MTPPGRTTVLVPYDQLSSGHGAMAHAEPATHDLLMVESSTMLRSRTWHAQRLHLVLSAAEHFAAEMAERGFTVHRTTAVSVADGVRDFKTHNSSATIIATEPTSHALRTSLVEAGIQLIDDDHFLTPLPEFVAWAGTQRSLKMETFYRWQRRRLGVMVDGDEPWGGAWNFDADNRLPPPKEPHPWPDPLRHELDDIDTRTWQRIVDEGLPVTGSAPSGTWGTTRAAALQQLDHFLEFSLPGFGPYEDAMPSTTWSVNHSLLSPYLNIGLISPREVVDAALTRFAAGGVELSSLEGFVRQIIGWREYVRGLYWVFGPDYRLANALDAHAPLPAAFEGEPTSMACMSNIVGDVHARGWVHHIPRLMVLANLALTAGVQPQAMLDWMRRMFVDAADWVMVPNVIGMGVHADGGRMMTKPYAAGGAYISRMGRYCSGCTFDPKLRAGEKACPFTTLYWDFLDRHRKEFGKNPRMAQQVRGLDRLSDLPELRVRAVEIHRRLTEGSL